LFRRKKSIILQSNSIVRDISHGKVIRIGSYNGKRTIAQSSDIFKVYISPDFKKYDTRGLKTRPIHTQVFELINSKDFPSIVSSFTVDLGRLALTQGQIVGFCVENYSWLK